MPGSRASAHDFGLARSDDDRRRVRGVRFGASRHHRHDRDLRRCVDANRQEGHPNPPTHLQPRIPFAKPPLLVAELAVVQRCLAAHADLPAVRVTGERQVDVAGRGSETDWVQCLVVYEVIATKR